MKKRIVAILLSFTLSSAMVTQAGAAALSDPTSEAVSQDVFTDSAADAAEQVPTDDGQTGEVETETPDVTDDSDIVIDNSDGETPSDGSADSGAENNITDSNAGENIQDSTEDAAGDDKEPQVDFADDLFSSGENTTEPDQGQQSGLMTLDENAKEAAASFETEDEVNHKATLLYTRWKSENGKWMLQKLPETTANSVSDDGTSDTGAAEVLDGTASDNGIVQDPETTIPADEENQSAAEESTDQSGTDAVAEVQPTAETEPVVLESEAASEAAEPETVPGTEAETTPEAVPETDGDLQVEVHNEEQPEAKAVESPVEYYKNTLLTVTTVDENGNKLSEGTYYFNENGCMLTGIRIIDSETDGFVGDSPAEYFFQYASSAKLNPGIKPGDLLTPYNTNMGQMKKNTGYIWEAGKFHKYDENGQAIKIEGNKMYSIGGQFYYLLEGGKPYIGVVKTSWNNRESYYAFRKAKSGEKVPGKMIKNGWASLKNSKGEKWLYFGKYGRQEKRGAGVYKVLAPAKNTEYLLDSYGYVAKNKVIETSNGSVYMSNKWGWIYKDSIVKWKNARYYFGKDGKRVNWTNRWIKVTGNKRGRYYYLGSLPGRISEKKGLQKIVMNGKFIGYFMFDSNGDNIQSAWSGDRYFISDGRMAGGPLKVGNNMYFFERSSSTSCRGEKYKNTWIKYNNKYYYAGKEGKLCGSGWHTINGGRYYFENWTAVTNKIKQDPQNNKWGWLDPGKCGKHVYGWIAYNNSQNQARYLNSSTGELYKNTTKWIDGVNYRFDSYGNRVNDRTSEFRRGSYYLDCDRVNGVITVYTDSSKRYPIKNIRVSVGLPGTPTGVGTFSLSRSLRWQPLMGPSWGQYGTHVDGCGQGGIFVHSVASPQRNGNNLPAGEYNKLGNPASHGCIRACVADAKWVYDNCNGSTIHIFDGKYNSDECFKGPLGRNKLTPLRGSKTFDPTDPNYN